ncbi:hypothetical protein [Labrys neptuniae]
MRKIIVGLVGLIFATTASAEDAAKPAQPAVTLEDLQKQIQAQSSQIANLAQQVDALMAVSKKQSKSMRVLYGYERPFSFDRSRDALMGARRDALTICRTRFNQESFATNLEQVSNTQIMFTCELPD